MPNEPAFDVGDFVFARPLASRERLGFFGFVAAKTDDGSVYDVAPVPRWNDGKPYFTKACASCELMHAVYTFAGPIGIDHEPR